MSTSKLVVAALHVMLLPLAVAAQTAVSGSIAGGGTVYPRGPVVTASQV